jgi:hypothetical protein
MVLSILCAVELSLTPPGATVITVREQGRNGTHARTGSRWGFKLPCPLLRRAARRMLAGAPQTAAVPRRATRQSYPRGHELVGLKREHCSELFREAQP